MKPSQLIAMIFCLALILLTAGCTDQEEDSYETASEQTHSSLATQNTVTLSGKDLTVHFLDVDQGDSILIEIDEKSMLIDAGESDQGEVVTAYLQDKGISTLDYVVATHPHSDHIGGMKDILNNFKVKHFVDSGYPHTSKTSENMLTAIDTKNITFEVAQAGQKINFDPAVEIEVLNPGPEYSDELNENSVVLKVAYGETSFLLMGDAGLETEENMMEVGYDIDSDILKAGHHASTSGSGETFISAVSPEVSIIEVGAGNDYGHPHDEVLDRLEKASTVYRTDLDGTIVVTTDGSAYTVTTEKTGTTSSRSGVYNSTDSTTEEQSEEYVDSNSPELTVYVSNLNLQDEWVQISNTGFSPVPLDGWKIEDEGNKHTYTFQSYTLNAGTTVTVFTGKGINSATELYWQLNDPVWNNDDETAYLYDNSGKLISKLES